MHNKYYLDLIENGKKLKNGVIRIIIPCSPLEIKSYDESLYKFIKQSEYKLINLQYHDRFKKLIGYVKRRDLK